MLVNWINLRFRRFSFRLDPSTYNEKIKWKHLWALVDRKKLFLKWQQIEVNSARYKNALFRFISFDKFGKKSRGHMLSFKQNYFLIRLVPIMYHLMTSNVKSFNSLINFFLFIHLLTQNCVNYPFLDFKGQDGPEPALR